MDALSQPAGEWTAVADALDALRRVGVELAGARSVEQAAAAARRHAQEHLSAGVAVLNLLDRSGAVFEVLTGIPAAAVPEARSWGPDADLPGPAALRERRTVLVPDRGQLLAEYPAMRPVVEEFGLHAVATVPLLAGGHPLGYLGVGWITPIDVDGMLVAHLETLGALLANVVERSRLLADAEAASASARREADRYRTQSELTETITENATSALFLMDANGHPTYMNSSAVQMFGYSLDEVADRPLHDAIHHTRPDGSPYPMEECPIDRALPEQRWLEPYEDLFVRKDGSFVPVRAAASPIMRGGRPIGTVVEVQDVTDERRLLDAERSARRRAEVLERNARQLAVARTMWDVSASVLGELGALAVRWASLALVEGGAERLLGEVGQRPGPGAAAVVDLPLLTGDGSLIGRLLVDPGDPGDPADGSEGLPLLRGLAEQCGVALERAVLESVLDLVFSRSTFLAELSRELDQRTTVAERVRTAESLLARRFGVDAAVRLDPVADAGPGDPDPVHARRAPDGGDGGGGEALCRPVVVRGRRVGELELRAPGALPAVLDPTFAAELAARIGIAVETARAYEQERHISHTLQLGLLGAEVASPPGLEVTTSYRAGTDSLEVGGDWYDVIADDDGGVVLVVGDVVGHDVDAAVAMGQLRGAVRVLAATEGPAALLDRLDRFVEHLPAAAAATVVVVALEPATGEFRVAAAGHPPPLVVGGAGPRLVWEGRSPPLGCAVAGGPRPEGRGRLGPGDSLVLYTDGLVERRGRDLLDALDDLAAVAARTAAAGRLVADELADELLEAWPHDDDACTLVCRRTAGDTPGAATVAAPAPFEHRLRADLAELAALRRALAGWAGEAGVVDGVVDALQLAVSEAAANAVEHGLGCDGEGQVLVRGDLGDGRLVVTVVDQGAWRTPTTGTDRGRGTGIMAALADDVDVRATPQGTAVRLTFSLGADPS